VYFQLVFAIYITLEGCIWQIRRRL